MMNCAKTYLLLAFLCMKYYLFRFCLENLIFVFQSVEEMTERFYNEMRRHYYTTPSSYLELIKLYKIMLEKRKNKLISLRDRIQNGLTKIYETNSVIDSMKETLIALEPELAKKSIVVADLMKNLAKEQKSADKVRVVVKADEEVAKVRRLKWI